MKTEELIEELKRCNHRGNAKVAFDVIRPHTSVGGSQRVEIKGCVAGFDWNDGTTFLQTEEQLYTDLEKLNRAAKAVESIHCWLGDKRMNDKDKIAVITRVIENYHARVAELADALDLGSSIERCAGSSPVPGTIKKKRAVEKKR